jgi:hypothetical protein
MSCPKCNHEINPDYFPLGLIFCPYCGQKIAEREPFQLIPFCGQCGGRLLTEVTFCPECGKRLVPEPPPPQPVVAETKPVLQAEAYEPETPEPEPVRQVRVKKPGRPLWPAVKASGRRLFQPVESFFSGRWRLKKLYREWSEHDSLPQEEIPADESLKEIAGGVQPPARRPVPVWLAVMLGAGLLLIFEAIGMYLKRPS